MVSAENEPEELNEFSAEAEWESEKLPLKDDEMEPTSADADLEPEALSLSLWESVCSSLKLLKVTDLLCDADRLSVFDLAANEDDLDSDEDGVLLSDNS